MIPSLSSVLTFVVSSSDGITKDICIPEILQTTIRQRVQLRASYEDDADWIPIMGCF